jgi:hypothetical protein
MRKRVTPAFVVALIALFVALTGTATATSYVLISGKQIKDGSIGLADLSKKAKRALKGQRGPAGPPGVQGAQGVAGGFDPAKVNYVEGAAIVLAPLTAGSATATCPAGATVLSGGWFVLTGDVGEVYGNQAADRGSWSINVFNHDSFNAASVTPYAVCASA